MSHWQLCCCFEITRPRVRLVGRLVVCRRFITFILPETVCFASQWSMFPLAITPISVTPFSRGVPMNKWAFAYTSISGSCSHDLTCFRPTSGNPVASAGIAASSTNFGTPGTDVMTASLSGSIAVGSTLTLTGAVQIVFSSPSATISFGTPSGTAMPATWLTLQPGFNAPAAPSTSATIGASAAPYDYNCPLNWRTASKNHLSWAPRSLCCC